MPLLGGAVEWKRPGSAISILNLLKDFCYSNHQRDTEGNKEQERAELLGRGYVLIPLKRETICSSSIIRYARCLLPYGVSPSGFEMTTRPGSDKEDQGEQQHSLHVILKGEQYAERKHIC